MKRVALFVGLAVATSAAFALAAKDAAAPRRDAGSLDAAREAGADSGAGTGTSTGADAGDAGRWHTCVEHLPAGAERPEVTDVIAPSGLSGYASVLRIKVVHGRGERVFPNGIRIESSAQAVEELKTAGFVIPDQDGGGAAKITFSESDSVRPDHASTTIDLPVLVLPPKPGRHHLTLPPLPVAIARAGGDLSTVCTSEHEILVEDPIANETDPRPHENPSARPQREEWTALREGLKWAGVGVVAGVLGLLLWRWWAKRPKPVPPPPPPRPPWEVALEELTRIRTGTLLERSRFDEYFDRVSDVVRQYLGARFGFDGLESTSDEILASLKAAQAFAVPMAEITLFLQECDLVKFAKLTPTIEQCKSILDLGEKLVFKTMPHLSETAPASRPSTGGAR
jgi:hypothetical protein